MSLYAIRQIIVYRLCMHDEIYIASSNLYIDFFSAFSFSHLFL
uniref:Uncharacterized protein n=1 Tax=Rhizophora mucronata TaxID=61149 RepID=A0A2P2P9I9_RHIMU